MTPSETRYARSGDLRIAYQVVGTGPVDVVFVPGFVSNIDLCWDMPEWANFFLRLAAFSRLILFDKRGTGLSDRIAGVATLEERMDDVRAVMDAAGSQRAALWHIRGWPNEPVVCGDLSAAGASTGALRVLCATSSDDIGGVPQ
jgi:pimeloyl-ACP methyl ester carboxylesterase